MTIVPQLLIGITSPKPFTVDIATKTNLGAGPPDLIVTSEKGETLVKYAGGWKVTLDPGSYVLRISVNDAVKFVEWEVSCTESVVFAIHRHDGTSPPISITKSWTGTSCLWRGDPKNPWPPPTATYAMEAWYPRALRVADFGVAKDG